MSVAHVLKIGAVLLVLLAVETGLAFTPVPRALLPGAGLVMAGVVALGLMRLRAAGTLAGVFAAAGLFWLCVMMGLGSMDPATRRDVAVARAGVFGPAGGLPPR